MKYTAETLEKKYKSLVRQFTKKIADSNVKQNFKQEIDPWGRRSAVAIWALDADTDFDYTKFYNAIYSDEQSAPNTLALQILTMLYDSHGLIIPTFFYDFQNDKKLFNEFVELCEKMFSMFAEVNGDVSKEQQKLINDFVAKLNMSAYNGVNSAIADVEKQINAYKVAQNVSRETMQKVSEQDKQEDNSANELESKQEAEKSLEELLAELDGLCGLTQVKKDVHSLINLIKVRELRRQNNLPIPPISLHLVFLGNPGTGKTTVARLLGKLYKSIGVLKKGQLIEVDRSGLVAGYVGQTAIQTQKVIESAIGGILFIDEAYALANNSGNDFGQEAIDTILKAMEDRRDELVIIVAGYSEPMEKFLNSNPGLRSRFNKYFYFDDYTGSELMQIFGGLCTKNGYKANAELNEYLEKYFDDLYKNRSKNFGNGRDVRNLFEKLIANQSDRVAGIENVSVYDLMTLTIKDIGD